MLAGMSDTTHDRHPTAWPSSLASTDRARLTLRDLEDAARELQAAPTAAERMASDRQLAELLTQVLVVQGASIPTGRMAYPLDYSGLLPGLPAWCLPRMVVVMSADGVPHVLPVSMLRGGLVRRDEQLRLAWLLDPEPPTLPRDLFHYGARGAEPPAINQDRPQQPEDGLDLPEDAELLSHARDARAGWEVEPRVVFRGELPTCDACGERDWRAMQDVPKGGLVHLACGACGHRMGRECMDLLDQEEVPPAFPERGGQA